MKTIFKWFWGNYFYEPVEIIEVHGWRTATIKNGFGVVETVTINVWLKS
jgi:hypothetical protein